MFVINIYDSVISDGIYDAAFGWMVVTSAVHIRSLLLFILFVLVKYNLWLCTCMRVLTFLLFMNKYGKLTRMRQTKMNMYCLPYSTLLPVLRTRNSN